MRRFFNRKQRYFDCGFHLESDQQVAALIETWLRKRKPASLIRLGDGEGMVLARPEQRDRTLWRHVLAHFGPKVSEADNNALADQLETAVDSADIVGVRDDMVDVKFPAENFDLDPDSFLQRFKQTFPLRPAEKDIEFSGALRLAHAHRYLSTKAFGRHTLFCTAWVNFLLSASGSLVQWIEREPSIGLISSKNSLAQVIERKMEMKVAYYVVPEMYQIGPERETNNYQRLRQTLERLQVEYRGQLFLVGAGVWGKVYCARIKQLGGIALDIGAVCDAWIDIPSRGLVYKSMFNNHSGQVPGVLTLAQQTESLLR